jgi:hypothetical protein
MAPFLQQIEQMGVFAQIRASQHAYPVLLWLHVVAIIAWGGLMLASGLRTPKYVTFGIAALTGILLFGAKASLYVNHPWFWTKMVLLALLPLCRRGTFAKVSSLALLSGAVLVARGPATVKDMMHSMVDPAANGLFDSVQIVVDEKGTRQEGPETDQDWQEVGNRAQVLLDVSEYLQTPGLRGARPRDRSGNPGIENEPGEIQRLMDSEHETFARNARRLHDAASVIKRAADAKDRNALWDALGGLDGACEVCHLRYWYPNDKRAVQAAKESGLIE